MYRTDVAYDEIYSYNRLYSATHSGVLLLEHTWRIYRMDVYSTLFSFCYIHVLCVYL